MQTTFVCKLWKLQSGPSDQHPRGMGDGIILQSESALGLGNHIFANPSSHSLCTPLDVDPVVQIRICTVCTEMLILHLICSILKNSKQYL